jgi:hypothetical protein
VAVLVDKNVLRLKIAVDDALEMQVLQGEDDLSGVELASVFLKAAFVGKMVKELTAVYKVHDQVEVLTVLERKVELHYKRVV